MRQSQRIYRSRFVRSSYVWLLTRRALPAGECENVGAENKGNTVRFSQPNQESGRLRQFSTLFRRLADENPYWGAPKIHGELQKLGLSVSERTVARYVRPPRTLAHTEYDFRLGFEIRWR